MKIKLGSTEKVKNFKKKLTLVGFIQSELDYWEEFFLERQPTDTSLKNSTNYIRINLIEKYRAALAVANQLNDELANSDSVSAKIEKMYLDKELLYSGSVYSEWVKDLDDSVLSLYIVGAYLKEGNTNVLFNAQGVISSNVKSKSSSILGLLNEASIKKTMFEGGYISNISSEKKSLSVLKNDWDKLLHKGENDLVLNAGNFDDQKKNYEECKNNFQRQFDYQNKKFKSFIGKSKKDMSDFEDFYENKLALDSAVVYWKKKKETSYYWSIGLAVSLVFIGYFIISYLLGISEIIGSNLLNVENIKLSKGVIAGTGKDVVQPASDIVKKLKYLPILHFAVISTFAVWGTRILVKIFFNKLHAADNAGEREMFIKSYLALLNEHKNSIIDEKDRQLILQSIFRPSSDGLINDDGPKITDILNAINRK